MKASIFAGIVIIMMLYIYEARVIRLKRYNAIRESIYFTEIMKAKLKTRQVEKQLEMVISWKKVLVSAKGIRSHIKETKTNRLKYENRR